MANNMASHMLPDLQDMQEEYNISQKTLNYLAPGSLPVRFYDDGLLSSVIQNTHFPGLLGIAAHSFTQAIAPTQLAGTARRTIRLPGLNDRLSSAFGSVCLINLTDKKPPSANTNFDSFDLTLYTLNKYQVIFHEIRHCAQDQIKSPYAEMDAEYAATHALKLQFNGKQLDFHRVALLIGNQHDYRKKYDHFLYQYFRENNLKLPSPAEIFGANAEVKFILKQGLGPYIKNYYSYTRPIGANQLSIEDDSYMLFFEAQKTKAYENLAPLARIRYLHMLGSILCVKASMDVDYYISPDFKIHVYPDKYKDKWHKDIKPKARTSIALSILFPKDASPQKKATDLKNS